MEIFLEVLKKVTVFMIIGKTILNLVVGKEFEKYIKSIIKTITKDIIQFISNDPNIITRILAIITMISTLYFLNILIKFIISH